MLIHLLAQKKVSLHYDDLWAEVLHEGLKVWWWRAAMSLEGIVRDEEGDNSDGIPFGDNGGSDRDNGNGVIMV